MRSRTVPAPSPGLDRPLSGLIAGFPGSVASRARIGGLLWPCLRALADGTRSRSSPLVRLAEVDVVKVGGPPADGVAMTLEKGEVSIAEVDSEPGSAELARLVAAHPDAIVAALADDGFRVPLPDAFPLGELRALAVPAERATMLDVVVADDRIGVVAAWERARRDGIAMASVRGLSDPARRLTLTMVDARVQYGTWLAVLTPDRDGLASEPDALVGPLVVPTRPRQATMHKNMTAVVTEVDANVSRMLGWTPEQLVGSRSSEFIHPDDQERAVATWMQLLASRGSQRVRFRHRHCDGSWLWIEVENIHNGADDPEQVDVVAHVSDISDEMAAHEALRRREQLFSRLAEALPTGVLQIAGDGSVIYANARVREILSADAPASAEELFAAISTPDRPAARAAVGAALTEGVDGELEVELRSTRPVRNRRCALTIATVTDQEGRPAVLLCLDDITESVRLREELREQATHDALTGLANHRALVDAIDHELGRARRTGRPLSVLFLDLDHFKALNDTLGHGAGDNALQETGDVIKASVREIDTVGRWGGEEFVALLPDTDRSAALVAAERIRSAIATHHYSSVEGACLTCSIGVATRSVDGSDRDTLLASADRAMYSAKRSGRNRVIAAS